MKFDSRKVKTVMCEMAAHIYKTYMEYENMGDIEISILDENRIYIQCGEGMPIEALVNMVWNTGILCLMKPHIFISHWDKESFVIDFSCAIKSCRKETP